MSADKFWLGTVESNVYAPYRGRLSTHAANDGFSLSNEAIKSMEVGQKC